MGPGFVLVDFQSKVSFGAVNARAGFTNGPHRYYGFTGYVDTLESLNSAYNELHKLGMLPPLKAKAQPLI